MFFIARQHTHHALPSVCPPRCDIVSKQSIMLSNFSPLLLGHHSSFLSNTAVKNFKGNPYGGINYTKGRKILRFSTKIAVYLGNGTRYLWLLWLTKW